MHACARTVAAVFSRVLACSVAAGRVAEAVRVLDLYVSAHPHCPTADAVRVALADSDAADRASAAQGAIEALEQAVEACHAAAPAPL